MAFSYTGLIEQLEFEGYTPEQATYAADHCDADWDEQAVMSAEQYLKSQPYSRQGLIAQLIEDGFTREQAGYAIEKCGY